MRSPARRALGAALAVALVSGLAAAQASAPGDDAAAFPPLAPRARALLLLRVLLYDRALEPRLGTEARVAVVFRPGDAASEEDRDALLAAFEGVAREVVVAGRPVRAYPVPFRGEAELAAAFAGTPPAAAYACATLERDVAAVSRVTRRARVLSAAGSRAGAEGGLALALVNRGSRAGLVVNLAAAREEGAELEAPLLAVAEVIGVPAAPAATARAARP